MTRRHKWICADGAVFASQPKAKFSSKITSFSKFGVAALIMLPGCALLHGGGSSSSPTPPNQRITQLEKMLRQQRGTIDEMREKNLVLEQRLRKSPRSRLDAGAPSTLRGNRQVAASPHRGSTKSPGAGAREGQIFSAKSPSALSSQEMPALDADEIVPIPFTPSAANGFDIDLARSPAASQNTGMIPASSNVAPNVTSNIAQNINSDITSNLSSVPTSIPLVLPNRGPVDFAGSVDMRARAAALETSPNVVLSRSHVEQDFLPSTEASSSIGTGAEVSAHRPGIGTDDLSFALKAMKNNPAASRVASVAPPDEKFSATSGNTGEHFLYSKVVNSYREHKMSELTKSTQLLLKSYPDSVFADNALYLNGLLSFEMNSYPQAEQYMNRVIREYPQGNKVVAAIFAKAMIAKKMKKYGQSESILQQVARTFPGSPEAGRVNFEVKLLKVAQAGRIREL